MYGFDLTLGALGLVAVFMALYCVWWRWGDSRKIRLMASTPTSKAAEVSKLAPGIPVEIKGTLRCANLLVGEFSQKPCVYFKAEIIKEETYYDRDSDGKNRQRTTETTTYSNIKHAPCAIEDDSGTVVVDLEGAEVEAIGEVDKTEGDPHVVGDLVGAFVGIGRDNTTFRRREFILPPDIAVYLLGEVQPNGTIGKPAKGSRNKTFLISHKSEEQRTAEMASGMTFLVWAAGIFAVVGAVLLVWAKLKGQR